MIRENYDDWYEEYLLSDLLFSFSTKMRIFATESYNYGHRFYNSRDGRFLNQDPIGEAGGVNLYGFVGNDPVNSWDFLGLSGDDDFVVSSSTDSASERRRNFKIATSTRRHATADDQDAFYTEYLNARSAAEKAEGPGEWSIQEAREFCRLTGKTIPEGSAQGGDNDLGIIAGAIAVVRTTPFPHDDLVLGGAGIGVGVAAGGILVVVGVNEINERLIFPSLNPAGTNPLFGDQPLPMGIDPNDELITVMYNTKHNKAILDGLLQHAQIHADKIGGFTANGSKE